MKPDCFQSLEFALHLQHSDIFKSIIRLFIKPPREQSVSLIGEGERSPIFKEDPKIFPCVPGGEENRAGNRAGVFTFYSHFTPPAMAILNQTSTSLLWAWASRAASQPQENRCTGQGRLIFLEVFLSLQEASTKALITSSSREHFSWG